MSLVQRAKDILLEPHRSWPVIDAEAATVRSIYVPYVLVLAAVPAVARFLAIGSVGGVAHLVVGYALSLAMVYVMALIVDALAPTFDGGKDPIAALKLVAYAGTAIFAGGIFQVVPSLSVLGLLAALYSIYLFYTGVPVLMRCPHDKAVAYTAAVVVCGLIAGFVLSGLYSFFTPSMSVRLSDAGPPAEAVSAAPERSAKAGDGKIEEMARRIEPAAPPGDPAVAAQAAAAVLGALGAKPARAPLPAAELKALLPEEIDGMKRNAYEAQNSAAFGVATSMARATYGEGQQQLELSVTDSGGLAGLGALAAWANVTTERETESEWEKVHKVGDRTVREMLRRDGSRAEYAVILPGGLLVQAQGRRVPAGLPKKAVDGLDLAAIEARAGAER